jgi:hypothetical protein
MMLLAATFPKKLRRIGKILRRLNNVITLFNSTFIISSGMIARLAQVGLITIVFA